MQRLQLNVTDRQRQRLDREAECTGLGLSEITRRALDAYFQQIQTDPQKISRASTDASPTQPTPLTHADR